MTSGSEDKIIAYFDGSLSDADSAELLHLTSVSPEIRDLFREHEMLRDLAHAATRSAAISPEVESTLFSRIEALAEKPVKEKAVLIFSRRAVVLAALALIFISGSLGYLLPKFLSGSPQTALTTLPKEENISLSTLSNSQRTVSNTQTYRTNKPHTSYPIYENQLETESQNITEVQQKISDKSASLPTIHPVMLRSEDIHYAIGNEKLSPFDLVNQMPESRSLFEIGLQTSSGFTYPADAAPIKPFADQRLSLAYHITENNLIGLRIGSGLYQQLGNVTRTQESGVEIMTRNIETKRSFSEELYLSHLEPIFLFAPFTLEFSIGGGFIPNGYSLAAEAGVRIPFSESWMMGVDFSLSRIHSNALSSSAILASENSGGKPIMLDGADIHNTLNGRLHYGLIYRF